ncbi:MAG: glycosyltransferase family 2 protein [Geothermobacteraceae bacterium]
MENVDMSNVGLVSFIVVNYNGKKYLKDCILSIERQTYKDFEIVIVDNGSKDGSSEYVRTNFPHVKLVELDNNRGFAGGNNKGLLHCSGKYVALVNNDVVLDDHWLMNALEAISTTDSVGMVSTKIFVKGTDILDSVGDRFTSAFTGTKVGEGCRGSMFEGGVEVDGVCAAAALYRTEMIKEIGFFDEDLFLNYEDTDLNFRAWLRGWKCSYANKSVAYHLVNATIGAMSPTSVYFFSRNSFLVLLKNFPLRLIVRRLPQRIFYEIIAFLYYAVINKRLISYVKGKVDALLLLPRIIKKRKEMVLHVKLSDEEILCHQYPIFRHIFDIVRCKCLK